MLHSIRNRSVWYSGKMIIFSLGLSLLTVFLANKTLGEGPPLLWFVPAVLLTSFLSGLIPGLISTALAAVVSIYVFFKPIGEFGVSSKNDIYRVVAFIAIGVVISFLMESLHRSRDRVFTLLKEKDDAYKALLAESERRKAAQESLLKKDAELIYVLSTIPAAVIRLDKDRRYLFCNDTFASWFSLAPEKMIGLMVKDIVTDDYYKKTAHYYDEAFGGKKVVFDEHLFFKDKGRYVHAEMIPEYSSSGEVVGCVIIKYDVSSHVLFEKNLESAKSAAEVANKSKSAFLAAMSHEIRTPLGVMLGCADMLASQDLSEEGRVYTDVILRNGQVLLGLINDILDLAKVESGKFEIENRRFSLAPVLNDLISQFKMKAYEKRIFLDFRVLGSVPEYIISDELRLRQILTNLLGNAIKFTDHGGVNVCAQLTSSKEVSGGKQKLQIAISDTGVGIASDVQQKIFDPFTQASDYINRKFGGTGLGLSLARNLAQSLGGDIWLESSELGAGSVFIVAIDPGELKSIAMLDDYAIKNYKAQEPSPRRLNGSQQLQGCSILLVEDFKDNQLMIKSLLTHHGAAVDIATNGEEGVEQAQRAYYDLIFMDIQMPVLNGYLAVDRLRQDGYDLPVVALTAEAMKGEDERCRAAGFDDYVSKPIDRYDLISKAERYCLAGRGGSFTPANCAAPVYSILIDDDVVADLLKPFVEGLRRRPDELRALLVERKWFEMKQIAHQLAGSGGAYGFPLVTTLSRKLEQQAKMVEPNPLRIEKIINQLERFIDRIDSGLEIPSHARLAPDTDARSLH